MLIRVIAMLLCTTQSRCSVVTDLLSQKNNYLSMYCPRSEFCPEGAHVMCMYYDPQHVMGPRCSNPQNISITTDIADKILEVSNAIRSRIALGKETGKDGPLPRGYGIFRLSWDEELAMFAQVLANQCIFKRDLCRSTTRFPDPGQATGIVRFSYPDWLPVNNRSYFVTAKLTPLKLNYAITTTLKTWYTQKNRITMDMIAQYPQLEQDMNIKFSQLYLTLIHGAVTHMGCGMSGYTQFAYHDNNSPLNYNTVQIVCNYSAKPKVGHEVYTTKPPTSEQIGYTIKCGCPPGYDEDADCLCVESRTKHVTPVSPPQFCSGDRCKQSVILLPIFTMEDAPPHLLVPPASVANNSRRLPKVFNQHGNYNDNTQTLQPKSLIEFSELLRGPDIARRSFKPKNFLVQQRISLRKPTDELRRYSKPNPPSPSHVRRKQTAKESIFSRVEKFQLPTRKVMSSNQVDGKEIKKDVAPRKDFSTAQKLLENYLNMKRNHVRNAFKGENYEYTSNEALKAREIDEHVVPNKFIKSYKEVNHNSDQNTNSNQYYGYKYVNTTNHISKYDIADTNENTDKKLMSILDNLEKEVKNIKLDPTDKEIFDLRIRKIYDKFVGRQNNFQLESNRLTANGKITDNALNENLINYEIAVDNELINKRMLKSPENLKLDDKYDTELVKRHQNSIRNINNRKIFRDYEKDSTKNNFQERIYRNEDDLLSYDRRKYYQEKLDNLQRKYNRVNTPRHIVLVRPTKDERNTRHMRTKKSKQMDTFYIPDRARFIQGF